MEQQVTEQIGKKTASPNFMMAVICLGVFIAAMDQTVIYGALPGMMNSVQLPVTQLDQAAWIVIGYLLGYTFAMPLIGRVTDVYGHRRVYTIALFIFIAGSVLVALSSSIEWLVGARIFQAIGGGALVPVAMAITGEMYTGKNRAVALGIIGAAVEAGGAIGPFYGALFAQFWKWQWIFWLNIPISLLILGIVLRYVRPGTHAKGKIDYLSALLLAGALSLFCMGVSQQADQEQYWIKLIGFVVLAAILFVLFIVRSLRVPDPLVKLAAFKNAVFSTANLTNLFVGGALIIAMVNIPLMSETILGSTALEGGLRLLRFTVLLSIGALAGGFLCKRFGYRLPTIVGLVMSAVGFWLMSRWTLTIADPQLTIHLGVCGFGFGLVIAPLGTAVMDSVSQEQKGLASSMVVMARMIGMMIGMAAITAWGMERFHLATASLSFKEIIETPEKLTSSLLGLFNNFYVASMLLCLVALLPALWLRSTKKTSYQKDNS
jgi:EmrB/QacA subfamily drug resistance transporter